MDPEVEQLEKINEELEQIKENTGSNWTSFSRGILQGSGAVLGSIAAIVLIGWALAILGIVPGLGDIAAYFNSIADKIR